MAEEHDIARPSAEPPFGEHRVALLAAALGLGLVSLVVHGLIAAYFVRAGVLRENNVLFDADPRIYTMSFAANLNVGTWGGRSFVHPHISNVIFPLVTATVHAFRALVRGTDFSFVSGVVAYSVCPVVAAIQTVIIFLTFLELGIGMGGAILLAILSLAAFSGLIFGSIPESYGLSGLVLATLFLLAVRTARTGERRLWPWIVVGCAVAGITITNLGLVAIVMGFASYRAGTSYRAVFLRVGLATLAIALITAGLYQVSTKVIRHPAPPFDVRHAGQSSELTAINLQKVVAGFPAALANTFVPPPPGQVPYTEGRQRHPFIMSYRAAAGKMPGEFVRTAFFVVALVLCASGVRGMAYSWQRRMWLAAALVIVFNWGLHAFYGVELFLYSQHWEMAELVLLSGAFFLPPRWRPAGVTVLVTVLVVCVVNSAFTFATMARTLGTPLY